MGTLYTKSYLQNPKGLYPKIKSLKGIIRSIASGIIPIYSDISWEFQKEYTIQLRQKESSVLGYTKECLTISNTNNR